MPTLKHIAVSLAVIMAPASVIAEEPTAHEVCTSFGRLAETVMRGRQAGVALSNMLNTLDPDSGTYEATRQIILAAFDVPRYHTPASQQRAQQDHRDRAERDCFRAMENRQEVRP